MVRKHAGALGVLILLAAGSAAPAQTLLYSNNANPARLDDWGLMGLSFTRSGVAAPPGVVYSELQGSGPTDANSAAGFSNLAAGTGGFRLADDFRVPAGAGWSLQKGTLFVYEPRATPGPAPVGAVFVQVWRGRPGDAGAVVVGGDLTTNRLIVNRPTNVYRIFNTQVAPAAGPDQTRRVWLLEVNLPAVNLAPGQYWLEWQVQSADPASEVFTPATTVLDARGPFGANGRMFRPAPPPGIGAWEDVVDPGKPARLPDVRQDVPFMLYGAGQPRACPADLTGIGGPPEPPDGLATVDDLIAFVNAFSEGEPLADVAGIGGPPAPPDQEVTVDDLIAFVNAFTDGCP